MADTTDEAKNSSERLSCCKKQKRNKQQTNLSYSEDRIYSYCNIENLPTEVVEMILKLACVASGSDKKAEFEKVFKTLSKVCPRWQQIINNPIFRIATTEMLIKHGFLHRFYKKPRYMKMEGTCGYRFFSLDDDGDLYALGNWHQFVVTRTNNPFVMFHYARSNVDKTEATASSNEATEQRFERHQYTRLEDVSIALPRTPLDTGYCRHVLTSTEWCQSNTSLYLGYYVTDSYDDTSGPYVCLRLSSSVWKDSIDLAKDNMSFPIKSEGVAAWILPPHPKPISIVSEKSYRLRVSNRSRNVTIIDNVNRRLIIYDQDGNPLGVVVLPEKVNGAIKDVAEVVTREENSQFIVQLKTGGIIRIAIDGTTQTIATDVDSCFQYNTQVFAKFINRHNATHISRLCHVDNDGLVVVILESKRQQLKNHRLVILNPRDLKPIGDPIVLPFRHHFVGFNMDDGKGHINFGMPSSSRAAKIYCCIVRPALESS